MIRPQKEKRLLAQAFCVLAERTSASAIFYANHTVPQAAKKSITNNSLRNIVTKWDYLQSHKIPVKMAYTMVYILDPWATVNTLPASSQQ